MARYLELDIDQLRPSRSGQPRSYFCEDKLKELADSFLVNGGILQPIIVRQVGESVFEIIAGERRWRAAPLAGLHRVPCLIKDEEELGSLFTAALTENIQREDLTPVEEALALQEIKRELQAAGKKGTQSEIAHEVSKGRDWVVKTLAILNLSTAGRSMFRDYPEELHKGHAYALQGLEPGHELELIEEILHKKLSVRAVEKRAKKYKDAYKNAPPDYSSDDQPDVSRLVPDDRGTDGQSSEGISESEIEKVRAHYIYLGRGSVRRDSRSVGNCPR